MSLKNVQGLIVDIDGVLFEGGEALIDIKAAFDSIKALELDFVIATNNSSRNQLYCVELLKRHGVEIRLEQVVNSTAVTLSYLKNHVEPHASLHVLGSDVLKDDLRKEGYQLIQNLDQEVEAVIVGIDKQFDYEKLKLASLHIQRGAKFIATNDDRTVRGSEGLVPASGTLVAALEAATSVKPSVMGKPHQPMYDMALEYLELEPEKVLMIGDQIETDIQGAQALGLKTALVLSGVCDKKKADAWIPGIDLIAPDFLAVINSLTQSRV